MPDTEFKAAIEKSVAQRREKKGYLDDQTEAAISRFRAACVMVAQANYQVGKAAPKDPMNLTNADMDRIAKMQFKPAYYSGPRRGKVRKDIADDPYSELWKEKEKWTQEARDATRDVLLLFKEHKVDASAIYLFLNDMNILRQRTGPWDNLPVDAALGNLRLVAYAEHGDVPIAQTRTVAFKMSDACELTEMSDTSVNKYAERAGVQIRGRGKSNTTWTREQMARILTKIASGGGSKVDRANAREKLSAIFGNRK